MARIRTNDGRLVDLLNITKEDVIPEVLIHSICLLNRFTGHTRYPYSVGQHTLNLVNYVPDHLKMAAMIHDWQEAWFNDLASPLKRELPAYKSHEKLAGVVVASVMQVSPDHLEELDFYDKSIYANERDALFDHIDERGMGDERYRLGDPYGVLCFDELPWRIVKMQLMSRFRKLTMS